MYRDILPIGQRYYSKYFNDKDFQCKCGCKLNNMSRELLYLTAYLRHTIGIPFIITSGTRCKQHNKNIGSSDNSSHTKGLAVDISITNSSDRFKLIKLALHIGINRIGLGKTFIHLDIDKSLPQNHMWNY